MALGVGPGPGESVAAGVLVWEGMVVGMNFMLREVSKAKVIQGSYSDQVPLINLRK